MVFSNYKSAAIAAFLFLLSPAASQADELAPLNVKGQYDLSWTGIPFGALTIDATEKDGHYKMATEIHFKKLINLVVRHESRTTVEGSTEDFLKGPRVYESHYKTKNKPRYVKLDYDAQGHIASETVMPPDNPNKRPPVPEAQKDGSADPVTAIAQIRRLLAKSLAEDAKAFSLPVFDGRRLYEGNFTIEGLAEVKYDGKKQPLIKVVGTRKPVTGFTQKELRDMGTKDVPLDLYFTPLPELMLVKMHLPMAIGAFEATLDTSTEK